MIELLHADCMEYMRSQPEVEEIRQLIAQGMTNKAIAAKYGVTHSMISLIRLGKSWAA